MGRIPHATRVVGGVGGGILLRRFIHYLGPPFSKPWIRP